MTLMPGEKFNINSSTDSDIVYTTVTVKLVPITSPFPPNNMRVEDIDSENDISLGTPITIGNYTGNWNICYTTQQVKDLIFYMFIFTTHL
jgi:hypothetical protein